MVIEKSKLYCATYLPVQRSSHRERHPPLNNAGRAHAPVDRHVSADFDQLAHRCTQHMHNQTFAAGKKIMCAEHHLSVVLSFPTLPSVSCAVPNLHLTCKAFKDPYGVVAHENSGMDEATLFVLTS